MAKIEKSWIYLSSFHFILIGKTKK